MKFIYVFFIIILISLIFHGRASAQIYAGQDTGQGIVYVDFVPDTTFVITSIGWEHDSGSFQLDMNKDGIQDLIIGMDHQWSPGGDVKTWYIKCLNNNRVIAASYADTLSHGQMIDVNSQWASTPARHGIDLADFSRVGSNLFYSGPWYYVLDKYLGIQIPLINDTIYGYIHIDNTWGAFFIKDYGYKAYLTSQVNPQSTTIYPNPFTDELNITVFNNEPSEIIIYDIASRVVFQSKFSKYTTLYTEQLAQGVYIYEVRNTNGVLKKGKIIKE